MNSAVQRPSRFYRGSFWKWGMAAARHLPVRLSYFVLKRLALAYWRLAKRRREVVIRNLAPALGGNEAEAIIASRRLFEQFAVKLVDLWRFESGRPVDSLFTELTGWQNFATAHARGAGVLLITPHLGNWEFGGPLLVSRGVKLHVITLLEPGDHFTELRQAARARWGIETLVIGNDAFAFVDIIKRLQSVAVVALLIDRPPLARATTVELFGKSFLASAAAAELGRASGCSLVPVYLPRTSSGYAAHILPEVSYDRAALSSKEVRAVLTQQIMRVFENPIRQHITQWYHFVPIWPKRAL